jgi:hypothetical protein
MNLACMLSLVLTLAVAQAPVSPLSVTPTRLTFIARADRTATNLQRVSIVSADGSDLPWLAVTNARWLRVGPASGRAPGRPTISVDVAGLAAGTYRGHVTISTSARPGPPAVVVVVVEIAQPSAVAAPPEPEAPPVIASEQKRATPEAAAQAPAPKTSPAEGTSDRLTVAAQLPAATRNLPYSQAIPVRGGKPPVRFRLTQGRLPPGFRLENGAVSGVARQAGAYVFVVTATDSASPPSTVTQAIGLRVILLYPDTAMTVYPASLAIHATAGTRRTSVRLVVSSGRQALDWRASVDAPWLTLKPAEGRGQTSLLLEADPTELAPGVYTATVTISMEGVPNSPARVPVQLSVRK